MTRLLLRSLGFTAGFAAALALSSAAMAQQFKWVDKDGRVQYGDSPPPGVKATPMRPGTGSPAPASPGAAAPAGKAPTTSEQDAAFRKRQEESQKAAQKSDQGEREAAQKKDQCARAQEYVRSLESGQRIALTDSKGERYFLDDDQRAVELSKARAMAQQSCN